MNPSPPVHLGSTRRHSRDRCSQAFPVFHALPLPCIILNANQRTKKRGRPGNKVTVRPYYLCTDGGACVSMHTLGGSGACSSRKILKIWCSEITSDTIFVLKFIFGLDAARILGPSVVGAPLAMLHSSRSLVVTCRRYQCQMWDLQLIGAKQHKFKTEVNYRLFLQAFGGGKHK